MRVIFLVSALWWSTLALAQDDKTLDAAGELVDVMRLDDQIAATVDPMIAQQVAKNPQLAPVEGVMRDFFRKYFTEETIRPPLVKLYAEHFEYKELKALTKFYRTPVGQKLLANDAELTIAMGAIGEQIVVEHQSELMSAVAAELMRQGAAPSP